MIPSLAATFDVPTGSSVSGSSTEIPDYASEFLMNATFKLDEKLTAPKFTILFAATTRVPVLPLSIILVNLLNDMAAEILEMTASEYEVSKVVFVVVLEALRLP